MISKDGQGLVFLSFSADELLAVTSEARCVLFIPSAKSRAFTASQKSDPP